MSRRVIEKVEVLPVGLAVRREFKFGSGSLGGKGQPAPVVLVKVTDSEGETGWGEGRPIPQWSYETIETAVAVLRGYLGPALVGGDVWDRRGHQIAMHRAIGRGPSTGNPIAKAALDMAIHDLCARAMGVPLRCLFGGPVEVPKLELSWTCTAHDATDMVRDIDDGKAEGMRHFNFKLGVVPETDEPLLHTVRKHAPAGAFLWADANQSLSVEDAVRLANVMTDLGMHLLEQPLQADQPQQMERLRQRTRLPLAIDESSVSPGDFYEYARRGLVDYFVLKVTRTGGLWPSCMQMATAAAAGIPTVVSGLTDGLLTKIAACQIAAAFGVFRPMALNGSQFVDESALYPKKAEVEAGGLVTLPKTPGIGVRPVEEAVRSLLLKL